MYMYQVVFHGLYKYNQKKIHFSLTTWNLIKMLE